ncbi:50S ribosomal protein L6, partial [Candidatus Woesearchaeota archaeon]|nr:50S ribosomal protein L6 [Candidatus Woesearchaeota archaeon]
MKQDLTEEIVLPADVHAKFENDTLRLKGPKGEISRTFVYPGVK